MAVLDDITALKYIKNPQFREQIEDLQKKCKELRAHVTGKDAKSYLPPIPQFERDELRDERLKMMISNVSVVSSVLKPRSRIFSAKGGVEKFIISDQKVEKKYRQYIDKISQGLSLKGWIQQVAINRNDYDPNGIVLIEVDGKKRCYPCFKSILNIHDRELNGRTPEYLIIKLTVSEIKKYKKQGIIHGNSLDTGDFFRVIDDATDRIFNRDKKIKEVPSFSKPIFPGIVSSNIYGDEDDEFYSPLQNCCELLKQYLLRSSLYNVVFARQAFPKEFMQKLDCPHCGCVGVIDGLVCPECHGTKIMLSQKHSDTVVIDWGDEANKGIPNPPMGSNEAKVDTLEFFDGDLERRKDIIHYQIWGMFKSDKISSIHAGVTRDTVGSNIEPTAYQAMLNSQPMVTQLVEFSKWYVCIYQFCADIIGKTLFPKEYKGSAIMGGDRFMIESPDATWDRYLKAVKSLAPVSELDSILMEYLENKYCNDIIQYRKYVLLLGVEPFLHVPVETVLGWDIPEVQKKEKIYFSEWKQSITDWEFISIADGVLEEEGTGLTRIGEVESDDEVDDSEEEFTESDQSGEKSDPIANLKKAFRQWVLAKLKMDEAVLPRVVVEPKSGLPVAQVAQPLGSGGNGGGASGVSS